MVSELQALAAREYVPSSAMALVQTGMGNKADALYWLDRAYQEHDFSIVFLRVAPWFDSLRTEARFEQLIGRMQLPSPSGTRSSGGASIFSSWVSAVFSLADHAPKSLRSA